MREGPATRKMPVHDDQGDQNEDGHHDKANQHFLKMLRM